MKLTAREDLALPRAEVFAVLADFPRIERLLLARGVDLERIDPGRALGRWRFRALIGSRPVDGELACIESRAPERLDFTGRVGGLELAARVDLVSLTRGRTRLLSQTELRPRTLRARIALQAARLARSRVKTRYRRRIHDLCRRLERELNKRRPGASASPTR